MSETSKIISDLGITIVLLGSILFLALKYIPKVIDIWIERAKNKDASLELAIETVKNNSRVVENNTQALQKNSKVHDEVISAMKKHNEEIRILQQDLKNHDRRAEKIDTNLEIIKEKQRN